MNTSMLSLKLYFRLRRNEGEDSFDELMERNRQKYLQEEVQCLEKTLAKRQGQLRDTERNLKDCNHDLKDAKEQVSSDMVNKENYLAKQVSSEP